MKSHYPHVSRTFEYLFTLFSLSWVAGVFVDGWAHIHVVETIESVFTPWHALFYLGIFATTALLIGTMLKNIHKRYKIERSLPREYMFSFYGIILTLVAASGDMLWHTVFGIENGIEALLSPTHILLALGGAITVGGPLHAIWYRDRIAHKIHKFPVVLSLTFVFTTLTFMTQFLQPFNFPWLAPSFIAENPINLEYAIGLGIGSYIIFSGIFMGLVLSCIRHFQFPFGSFAFMLGVNTLGMTLLYGKYYYLIAAAVIAGLFIDLLYRELVSLIIKEHHIRAFGFFAPTFIIFFYTLFIVFKEHTWWSPHMWIGGVLIAGITGYLLTYLVVPPGDTKIR